MTVVILATRALLVALAAMTAVGCHRAQAARLPSGPPVVMDVPEPPERVVIPVVLAEYEPPPPPSEEPAAPAPSPSRPLANRPPDKPAVTPAAPPAPDPPAPVLQTTTNPNAREQQVIVFVQAAERDLGKVTYGQLSASAKDTYRQIQSDLKLARDALSIKHYEYALRIAERSATLAALLVKR